MKVHITSSKAPRAVWRARWCQSGKPPDITCEVHETDESSQRKRKHEEEEHGHGDVESFGAKCLFYLMLVLSIYHRQT